MARDIRTTLAVDGEQAYTRAIKEASQSLTRMGTQLTLATAEFKKDGDAMKLMESRSKTLRAEIDQQEKIVKSLEGAVQDMTEQYGENSKEVEKWQAELNRAQAKLINLQTELENNDQGLDKNGRAFGEAKDKAQGFGEELSTLQKIQQSTTFQALNTALGKIESGFKSALNQGKQFASYIWNMASESSDWADDLATESTKLGISVETLQGWMDAAHFVDTEVSTIKSGLVKLTDPTDELIQALKNVGVAYALVDEEGYTVHRSTVDLLWDTVDALSKETDAEKRNAAAKELFGKSYMDMLPLLEKGKAGWDEYVKSAEESGRVLSEEQVGKLTTFNDAIQEFNLQLEAFQHTLSAEIAPGLTTVTEAGTKFLEQLTLWAQSDEGQAKLTELSDSIAGLVSSLATEENFNAVVEGATGVINNFTSALSWINENYTTVETGVLAIGAAFAGVKIAAGVLPVLAAMKLLNWTNVATGAAAMEGAFTAAPAAGWTRLLDKLLAFAPYIAGLTVLLTPQDTAGEQWDSLYDQNGNVTEAGKANGLPDTVAEYDAMVQSGEYELQQEARQIEADLQAKIAAIQKYLWRKMGSDYTGGSDSEFKRMIGQAFDTSEIDSLMDLLSEIDEMAASGQDIHPDVIDEQALLQKFGLAPGDTKRAAESIYDDLYAAINDYDPAASTVDTSQFFDNTLYPLIQEATGAGGVVGDSADAIADLIYDKWIQSLFDEDWEGTTDGLLNILQEAIEEAQAAAEPDAESAGQAVSDGVASGIDAGIPAAVEATGRLAAAVSDKLRSMLQIASPSKVTRGLGQFVGIGFAEGIDDAISAVEAATGRMAVAVAGRGYGYAGAGYGGTYSPNYARTMNIQNYYQRSDADIDSLMDAMNQESRYERAGRGA